MVVRYHSRRDLMQKSKGTISGVEKLTQTTGPKRESKTFVNGVWIRIGVAPSRRLCSS